MSLRVVLDTNIWISGLLAASGPPRKLIDSWLKGEFTLITSLYQVEELQRVLTYPRIARRIQLTDTELAIIFRTLVNRSEVATGDLDLHGIVRDPKDDAIIATAVNGQADYLISGDEDLLVLDSYAGVKILTPREFISLLTADI